MSDLPVRWTPAGADVTELACGEARVLLAWRDGAWWVQAGGYTRRLRSEHGGVDAGFYDPGDGLPPHGGSLEVGDAPRRPLLVDEEQHRDTSRAAARRAAERLVRALAADPRAMRRELEMHPGWRRLPGHVDE